MGFCFLNIFMGCYGFMTFFGIWQKCKMFINVFSFFSSTDSAPGLLAENPGRNDGRRTFDLWSNFPENSTTAWGGWIVTAVETKFRCWICFKGHNLYFSLWHPAPHLHSMLFLWCWWLATWWLSQWWMYLSLWLLNCFLQLWHLTLCHHCLAIDAANLLSQLSGPRLVVMCRLGSGWDQSTVCG